MSALGRAFRALASSWRRPESRRRLLLWSGAVVAVVALVVVVAVLARPGQPSAESATPTHTTTPAATSSSPGPAPTEAESAEVMVEALPGDAASGISAELTAAGVDADAAFPRGPASTQIPTWV